MVIVIVELYPAASPLNGPNVAAQLLPPAFEKAVGLPPSPLKVPVTDVTPTLSVAVTVSVDVFGQLALGVDES